MITIQKGQTINVEYHCNLMCWLIETLKERLQKKLLKGCFLFIGKRPWSQGWKDIFLRDTEWIDRLSYSPNLVPSDLPIVKELEREVIFKQFRGDSISKAV